MPMTRREAVMRATSALPGFAFTSKTGPAQQPTDTVIPPGVVTLEDFEALAKQRLSAKTFEGVRGAPPTRSRCDGIGIVSIESPCAHVCWSTSPMWTPV